MFTCSGYMYVPSQSNPADDPTRDVALRKPFEEPPAWLLAALHDQFDSLDEELTKHEVDIVSLLQLPPFAALRYLGPVEPILHDEFVAKPGTAKHEDTDAASFSDRALRHSGALVPG